MKKYRNFSRAHKIERMIAFGLINGEGDGNGNNGGSKIEITAEDLNKKIQEAVDAATTGLKTKNAELLGKQKSLEPIVSQIQKLGDADSINALLEFKTKIEQDEILKLASEGKHSEAIEKALEKTKVTFNAEKQALETQIEELKNNNSSLDSRLSSMLLDGEAMKHFVAEKGHEAAIPDVVLRVKTVFKVENGEVVARNEKGEMIQGEKGPLTISEFVKGLKTTAPHLFPNSAGLGGGGGSGGGGAGGDAELAAAAKKGAQALRELKAKRAKAAG